MILIFTIDSVCCNTATYSKINFHCIHRVLGWKTNNKLCFVSLFEYIADDGLTFLGLWDPCYPACISGEQAAPQTNEKDDREREKDKHPEQKTELKWKKLRKRLREIERRRRRRGIPKIRERKREINAVHTGIICKTLLRANHYQSTHTTSTQTRTKKRKKKPYEV